VSKLVAATVALALVFTACGSEPDPTGEVTAADLVDTEGCSGLSSFDVATPTLSRPTFVPVEAFAIPRSESEFAIVLTDYNGGSRGYGGGDPPDVPDGGTRVLLVLTSDEAIRTGALLSATNLGVTASIGTPDGETPVMSEVAQVIVTHVGPAQVCGTVTADDGLRRANGVFAARVAR